MKKGSCEKFIALFERRLEDILDAAPDKSVIYTDDYKTTLLVGKLKHSDYALMTLKYNT